MGGVPSEPRFQDITQAQWTVLLNHYYDKKERDHELQLQVLEYTAQLTSSMNPEAIEKHTKRRRNHKKMLQAQKNPENYLKVNSQGQNELGHTVNTTFFETIKKISGDKALAAFETPEDYKVEQESPYVDEAEEKFIREARRLAEQRKKEIIAEKKFKKEHPELFPPTDAIRL